MNWIEQGAIAAAGPGDRDRSFHVVCEVDPPARPDLSRVDEQVAVLESVATAFLVPDNHLGRATMSSLVVAGHIAKGGKRAIACLNARDRNLLGFRRDLISAAWLGIGELLLVYGDSSPDATRTGALNVRQMLSQAREIRERSAWASAMRFGVSASRQPLPLWKRQADFVFAQVGYDVEELVSWRATLSDEIPVLAGVLVVASAAMAQHLAEQLPEIAPPQKLLLELKEDPDAGVRRAVELVGAIKQTKMFAGVHLVCGKRYRDVASELSRALEEVQ